MNEHSFTVRCIPPKSTHQGSLSILKRKDGTQFVGKFTNSKGKKVQNDLIALFSSHVPGKPFMGPVKCSVVWAYPWNKTEKKKNKAKPYRWCDKRPDCDNLVKMVKDILTRLNFWNDDSQVAWLEFKKIWTEIPYIKITIEELQEPEEVNNK